MNRDVLTSYLAELARALRHHGICDSRILEETREHLIDAVEDGQRRGLAPEAAEREAIERFGSARAVAAKFAGEKFGIWNRICFGTAVLLGLAIAYVDSRPAWDDAGITALLMLISAGMLGLIRPQRPWLWALAIGIWIPLHLIARTPSIGSFAGGLVILAFPMVGAYAGMLFRRMLASI